MASGRGLKIWLNLSGWTSGFPTYYQGMSTEPGEAQPLGDDIQLSVSGQTTTVAPIADKCL